MSRLSSSKCANIARDARPIAEAIAAAATKHRVAPSTIAKHALLLGKAEV